MNKKLLTVSLSPHIFDSDSTPRLMYSVIIALLPALVVSAYVFGIHALTITTTAVGTAVLCEYVLTRFVLKRSPTVHDGSAIITGMLLAYNLPSSIPLWMVAMGSVVAIGIAKVTFGGLGNNPFNPALVGRVFLLLSFPVEMTHWPKPFTVIDGITGATPLAIVKEGLKAGIPVVDLATRLPSYFNLFMGNHGGCIGEVSILALLIGAAYLFYRRTISWHIPTSIIATVAMFTGILWLVDPGHYMNPLFHLLSGGLMLGAFFMATDYVTSPMTGKGMIIFGIGVGLLTVVIRAFGAYPEGMSFAILIMNAFVPLINRYTKPRRFGEK